MDAALGLGVWIRRVAFRRLDTKNLAHTVLDYIVEIPYCLYIVAAQIVSRQYHHLIVNRPREWR